MAETKAIFDKNNVIVFGGGGFLGSHLCEELLKKNKVICVDNFISGSRSNIEHLLRHPDFIFLKHDFIQPLALDKISELHRFNLEHQGIQDIYNLAIPMNPKDFEDVQMETLLANTHGTKNTLDMAKQYKARYMFTSSSVVYGSRIDQETRFNEDYIGTLDQFSPRSNYDLGKKMGESMVYFYNKIFGIDTRIVRIFRTYGPRTPLGKGHMLPDFIVNALKNEDLVIYGDENFSTSLTYVSDVIDGIIKVMYLPDNPGPINLGNEENLKLVDVCQKIITQVNSKSKIRFTDPLSFMTELGLPDITKARHKVGWLPVVTIDSGIDKTIEYTRAHQVLLGIGL